METQPRLAIAQSYAKRLATHYGAELRLAAVLGSVARGEDTSFSDLDLFIVSASGAIPTRSLLFQGWPISITTIAEAELTQRLQEPDARWPKLMGVIEELRVLVGDPSLPTRWLAIGQGLTRQQLHSALDRLLPGLVFESYGRVRSSAVRKATDVRSQDSAFRSRSAAANSEASQHAYGAYDALHAAVEIIYEMHTALCLLNGRWVHRDYYAGIVESFGFPLLPEGYAETVSALWVARDLDTIVTLSGTLVSAYWRLITAEGLNVINYQTVESLPL
jgi:predicted nucleotidyltransferase